MAQLIKLLTLCFIFPTAYGAEFLILPEQSPATFLAIGKPSALKITGTGASVSGSLVTSNKKLSGKLSLDLNKFTTGMSLRDKHMKEKYLETAKPNFDQAVLSFQDLGLESASNKAFTAKLNLHGVEKEINGLTDLKIEEKSISGTAKIKLKLSDFGIAVPSFSGITVAEDVEINIKFVSQLK
jgi:polyisoprenoid-binding protein YceI